MKRRLGAMLAACLFLAALGLPSMVEAVGRGSPTLNEAASPVLWAHSPRVSTTASATVPATRAELTDLQFRLRSDPEGQRAPLQALVPRLAHDPALQIEALASLGGLLAVVNDGAALKAVETRLREWPDRAGNPAIWARLMADTVRVQWMRRNEPPARAERLLAQSLARVELHGLPPPLRLRALSAHAATLVDSGRSGEGVQRLQEVIALADEVASAPWERAEQRAQLAFALNEGGEKARARELIRAALALAEAAQDHRALSLIHTNNSFVVTGDARGESSAEERDSMRAAVEHARRAGARRDEALALANLADLQLRHGDYAGAIAQSEQTLPLARALHDDATESVALANIGLAQIMLGRKAEGLRRVRASIAIDERTGAQAALVDMQAELGHYLERAGHLREAYAAYREHRRLATEFRQRDQRRSLAELQEAFDHEQRQRELQALESAARLQRAQQLSDHLTLALWIGGALLAAIGAALGVLLLLKLRQGNRALAMANEQLSQLARHDPLTGLANRRQFQAAVREDEAKARPADGLLLLIDIDHFKQINDRFGHAVGDAVLIEVARRLRASLRDDDLIVRWGGEEFLVRVPPGVTAAPEEAQTLVRRLLRRLGRPVKHGAVEVPLSVSIGYAAFPLEPARLPVGWRAALELVDTAMYLAKAHGRNRAYGLRQARAQTLAGLAAATRDLEAAWRDGRIDLVALEGPRAADGRPALAVAA